MAFSPAIIGAVVMGGVLALVFGAIAFGRQWERADVTAPGPIDLLRAGGIDALDPWGRIKDRPMSITFAVIGIGVVIGAVGFAAALATAANVESLASTLAIGAVGFLVALYLLAGTYMSVRTRGHGSAGATAAVGVVLGVLLLVAITARLLVGA